MSAQGLAFPFVHAGRAGVSIVGMALLSGIVLLGGVATAAPPRSSPESPTPDGQDAERRGAYLFDAAGCGACHTDPGRRGKDPRPKGQPLAGGRPLATPFGTFYVPNITPDPEHGIGRWTFADFRRALRHGRAPDGAPYYPAFPYPFYAGMRERDLRDLWAYLRGRVAVPRPNRAHELKFPFSIRPLLRFWQAMFFSTEPFRPDPARSPAWNRGAYLVRVLGHCGACHTPRNSMGARVASRELAGATIRPGSGKVPNITPHPEDGIGDWSLADIATYLKTGLRPDGDFAGDAMAEVIEASTSRLTDFDRHAIAVFLKSLPPMARNGERR